MIYTDKKAESSLDCIQNDIRHHILKIKREQHIVVRVNRLK